MLPRFHLYEFNDDPRLPGWLHEAVRETLAFLLHSLGVYKNTPAVVSRFLENTKSTSLVEVCCGSGGPSVKIAEGLKKEGKTPRIFLTDLIPAPEALHRSAEKVPEILQAVPQSVDALAIPEEFRPYPRMVITAFHHFPPPLAKKMVEKALEEGKGILIMEPMERTILAFFLASMSLPFVLLSSFFSPCRIQRLLFTWLIPLIPLILLIDGCVSALRMYRFEELEEMIPLPLREKVEIEKGQLPFLTIGKGYYWMAWKKE